MTYPLNACTDACISFVRKHLKGYFKMTFYKKKQEKYFNRIHTIIKYTSDV